MCVVVVVVDHGGDDVADVENVQSRLVVSVVLNDSSVDVNVVADVLVGSCVEANVVADVLVGSCVDVNVVADVLVVWGVEVVIVVGTPANVTMWQIAIFWYMVLNIQPKFGKT